MKMGKINKQDLADLLNRGLEPGRFIQLDGKLLFGPVSKTEKNKVDAFAPGTILYTGHFSLSSSGSNNRVNLNGGYFEYQPTEFARLCENTNHVHVPVNLPENYALDLIVKDIHY